MSRENVELVKSVHPPSGADLTSLFAAGAEDLRRFGALATLLTDDFEAVGGDEIHGALGLTSGGEGIEGLVSAWRSWLAPWESYWSEVEEFVDVDDERVVVLVRDHGRLRGSTSEVENISASIWTVRGGKIARIEFHTNRAQALKVAGLED